MKLLFLSYLLGAFCMTDFIKGSTIVKIKNGTLEGLIMKTRRGRDFVSFRGIPYALPPLGDLRFEPPKSANSWSGVRSAKEDGPICTSRNIYTHDTVIVGQEDCLYLNVYTPMLPTTAMKEGGINYPVMIWFHGGGWLTGAGHSEYYHPKFFLDHDVILVTVNFRLGPLGFLSTEDLICPGNQGMKDQSQAIRWANENIASFGGDPNRVTIFGESAGGASTQYHMISPLSRGLIHRGISQSGTVLCPWVLTRPGQAIKQAMRLGKHMNCPVQSSLQLLDCLRKKDAKDIIGSDEIFKIFDYDPMIPFRPVIEPNHPGAFLNEEPAQSLKYGNMADIPWITGFNSHEGSIRVAGLYGIEDKNYDEYLDENFIELASMSLLYEHTCPQNAAKEVAKKIRKFYLGDKPIDESTKFQVIDMYSDAWFNVGADMAVRDHLNALSSSVYYYYFAYKGSSSFSNIFGAPKGDYGVSHADELQYLFPVGEQLFKDTKLSKDDHEMITILTTLWTNFATTGNPTPFNSLVPIKWKPVRSEDHEYLHIKNPRSLKMSKNLMKERFDFWATLPHRATVPIAEKVTYTKDEL